MYSCSAILETRPCWRNLSETCPLYYVFFLSWTLFPYSVCGNIYEAETWVLFIIYTLLLYLLNYLVVTTSGTRFTNIWSSYTKLRLTTPGCKITSFRPLSIWLCLHSYKFPSWRYASSWHSPSSSTLFYCITYPCALMNWFLQVCDEVNEDTWLWVVEQEFDETGAPLKGIIHLSCIFQAAHLLGVFGETFIP